MVILDYSFKLESEISELKTLHRHLVSYGKANGLSEACMFDINISLDEIFTNIVSYGFRDRSAHSITFTIKLVGNELTFDVEDDGVPFNPLEVKEPMIPENIINCKVGGLGIHLVKKLMDEICYKRKPGKNKLTLRKYIDQV